MLDDYRASDSYEKCAYFLWTDIEFTPETTPGWTASTPLITGRNHFFTTTERSAPMSLCFTGGTSKVFDQVTSLTFDTLSKLNISNHCDSTNGGSINLSTSGKLSIQFVDNGQKDSSDLVFNNNKISASANKYGGAIYANNSATEIDISHNGGVLFSENSTTVSSSYYSYGGAIYSAGETSIRHNTGAVLFTNNSATTGSSLASGGAIYSTKSVIIDNNVEDISFTDNYASTQNGTSSGGAVYSSGDLIVCDNKKNVNFVANHASSYDTSSTYAYGGAIYSTKNINISNNGGNVSFEQNYTFSDHSDTYTYSSGGGYYPPYYYPTTSTGYYTSDAYGGAIYSTGSLIINNNDGLVTFRNNSTTASASSSSYHHAEGGAIYSTGSISITGNSSVIFEKNHEKLGGSYQLRSIYMAPNSASDTLVLAARTGGHITFYDSVYMAFYSGCSVSMNADYTDASGATQKATGDIIFSGEFAAEHLAGIKGSNGTSSEITNSQTNEINNLITLYGGSLQVVDGAKLNGRGLTVAADSHATLLLRDGSMSHSSYAFTFNTTSTLELQGLNTITASKVTMASGTSLLVTLNKANLTTAALTLGGTDLATSQLTVHLQRTDGLRSGMYKIISQSSSSDFTTQSAWTAANVTVTGSGNTARANFADLVWENGTLYYKVGRNIWTNTSGDSLWNSTSDNWTMNGRSYTYLDGMDVSFTDAAAGTVKLVGDIAAADILVNNTSGNDYTFTAAEGGGKLTGAASLTKQGSGELTLDTANDYTGSTNLQGGTLNVHHSSALGATADGSASVTTEAGTTLKAGNNSHLVLAGSHSLAGAVEVEAGATLEMGSNGYASESSLVNGTLQFKNAAASTNTLSGSGVVQVEDSQVTVNSLSSFTGSVKLECKDASLSISSGNYNAAGTLSVTGGQLTFGGKSNITLNAGGQLILTALEDTVARVTANNINIKNGATLAADTLASPLGDAPELSSREVGAELNFSNMTLYMGATLDAEDAYFDLNNGTLVLAVTQTGTEKINLILAEHTVYTGSEQIVLFANAGKVSFIYNNVTATSGDGSCHTLNAADYFTGTGINETTQLVYDSTTGTLYLQGVDSIPEPATTTLSLLALAALAARRRRK